MFFLRWFKKQQSPLSSETARLQEMIKGINTLSKTLVKEIMIPRIDVAFIEDDLPGKDLANLIATSGHSRFPVRGKHTDDILGILYVKDIIPHLFDMSSFQLSKILRTPYFVPETKKLDSLLREMQKKRVHIAIVVDEYGGVSGIVCFEDIIEEIVGEIQDEFDHEEQEIVSISEYVYLCDARVNLDELNEKLHLELPIQDSDTLGGFVFELFDKIPVRFEKVKFDNVDFIVQEMEGRIIKKIKLVMHSSRDMENAAQ